MARQEIRMAGVALLEKLHESGAYQRIVLVGHSLGSVIGYDLITHYWVRCNERHGAIDGPRQDVLARMETLLDENAGQEPKQWQKIIHDLWQEQRRLGNPWLITDFITAGSPLAHAVGLLSMGEAELQRKKMERELPIAPPMPEKRTATRKKATISYPDEYKTESGPQTIQVLHHAAPFAVTRWTNLYFPVRSRLGRLHWRTGVAGIRGRGSRRSGGDQNLAWLPRAHALLAI
jgi:hypothetical protein